MSPDVPLLRVVNPGKKLALLFKIGLGSFRVSWRKPERTWQVIGKRRHCCVLTGQGFFRRRPLTPGVCFTPLNFLAVGSHLGFQTAYRTTFWVPPLPRPQVLWSRRRRTQSAEPVKGWGPRRSKPVPRHLWHPRMTGGLVQKMVDAPIFVAIFICELRINHQVLGYPIFRQTQPTSSF